MDETLPKSFNPTKHLKEQFVSNLTGTSMLEIFSLSTTVSVSRTVHIIFLIYIFSIIAHFSCFANLSVGCQLLFLLRHIFMFSSKNISEGRKKKDDHALVKPRSFGEYMATLSLDFLLIVLPVLLLFTVMADWINISAIFFAVVTLFSIVAKRSSASFPTKEAELNSLRAHISTYRVGTMLATCLCILSVDFKIFPRRLAKTETYGISLMDLGVGSFVLANSFVSREARNISSIKWTTVVRSTSPLILLGIFRLLTTTGVDYQVHVGEYGVHWNFFFTLAAVAMLTSLVRIPPQYSGVCGLLILIGYQYCLISGLNAYLLTNERGKDIISQNKEGLFSIFGYWGMYLTGVSLGNYLFYEHCSSTFRSVRWARMRIWILCLLFWLSTVVLDKHVERVSRRMCNLAYVTYVLANNLQVLSIVMLADNIQGSKNSVLEGAFDQNLLATFLLANILTGAVNLFVDTLSSSSVSAFVILLLYAYILSIVMGLVHFYKIRLKFW